MGVVYRFGRGLADSDLAGDCEERARRQRGRRCRYGVGLRAKPIWGGDSLSTVGVLAESVVLGLRLAVRHAEVLDGNRRDRRFAVAGGDGLGVGASAIAGISGRVVL